MKQRMSIERLLAVLRSLRGEVPLPPSKADVNSAEFEPVACSPWDGWPVLLVILVGFVASMAWVVFERPSFAPPAAPTPAHSAPSAR